MSQDPPERDPPKPAHPLADPAPVEHGGRVELRLASGQNEASQVIYDARWFTADQELEGRVSVLYVPAAKRPEVQVEAPDALPNWLSEFTTSLVRTTARHAEGDQLWPRRLTRWRSAPESRVSSSGEQKEKLPGS